MSSRFFLILIVVAAVLKAGSSAAQAVPGEILDMTKIRQKAVRDLVYSEKVSTASDFQHITTSCYSERDSQLYHTDVRTYVIRAGIDQVWQKYTTITPRKAWNGRLVKFGFLFSRLKNTFVYADNADEPIHVGNIVYVNLRLLRGLKNMGVAFEITRLDEVGKVICFCYLRDGISQGSQEIRFAELTSGYTKISHITHYRSHSAFRDRELYPIFHARFVGEFHQNVLSQITSGL